MAAAWLRSLAPSFSIVCLMWTLTVSSEMDNFRRRARSMRGVSALDSTEAADGRWRSLALEASPLFVKQQVI